MLKRTRREYLRYLDAARVAIETGIDAFNRVWHPYRDQTTLILVANAWELLAKAVLLHDKQSIVRGKRGETISGEVAVSRLVDRKTLAQDQAQTVQQVISLRNAASHGLLPAIPPEVMQHLLFYSCKFFRGIVSDVFPAQAKSLPDNYLSLSFSDLTTYADRVQRAVSRVKKSASDRQLVWLLERGIVFDGTSYITEPQFEQRYRNKKRVLPHLGLSGFIKKQDMVRIVPIQAPRNFTADITLRKGSAASSSLPVIVKKTEIDVDYPFLTKEVGAAIQRDSNWVAKAASVLDLKGNAKYHQAVRASAKSSIQRYSQAAVEFLKQKLTSDPAFDPYHIAAKA